jgi:filamentous hemagglutinin family protein
MKTARRQHCKVTIARRDPASFKRKTLAKLVARCFVLAACGAPLAEGALAAAPAPGVRIPLTALPSGVTSPTTQVGTIGGRAIYSPQVVSGTFNPYAVATNANGSVTGTITQTANAGILQWDSFDIGGNATVNVVQPSSTAVLLNKVSGGAYNNTTLIEGKLSGNGQIYIYNPNGIIFGKTSQVDVNSLVATTLRIDDKRFLGGLLAPNITPVFVADPDARQSDGTLVGSPGAITVEGDSGSRASLSTTNGGRILLVAPSVTNNGDLAAADGQVVLAAGRSVFLTSPSDIRMRGVIVEVNNDEVASSKGNPKIPAGASTATNDLLGRINVGTGNATLVGLAVNQMGLVSATTSVNVNGSIYLHARDGAAQGSISAAAIPGNGGALVLGAGSTTEILPTLADSTTTTGSSFNASQVDLSGNSVHLLNNAMIVAPAGEVTVKAGSLANGFSKAGSASGVTLDSGAVIDVSGTTATQLTMESNVIQVDLRGTEFADDPLLRNSVLRGMTVSVDARKGNLQIANIQGWLDLIPHNVGERTAIGGTVTLQADDSVTLNQGSRIDVSGGMVSYLPGYVAITQLTANGRAYDINSATPDRIYDAVIAAMPGPRNFEAGYSQGYSAGTLQVSAPALQLGGTLRGAATPGPKQRDLASASRPLGGQLIVGSPVTDLGSDFIYKSPVFIGSGNAGLLLDPLALSAEGFTRLGVYTEGAITVNSPVNLLAGGALNLVSVGGINLAAAISAPGGKVSALSSALTVEPGVTLDVSGQWVNDRVATAAERDLQGNPINPIVMQGGSIDLTAATMTLAAGSHFSADGGAWLNASGKMAAGNGGSIGVSATTDPAAAAFALGDGVVFDAYAIAKGGSLALTGGNVGVGFGGPVANQFDLQLDSAFFQLGGFSAYNIRAARNLTVADGTSVAPRMDNWFGTRSTATTASGSMRKAFALTTLPLGGVVGSRGASSVSLSALAKENDGMGRVNLQAGASIVTDPGGTVSLSAGRQLTLDGTIRAPGGTINLALTPVAGAVPYRAERSIWLGAQSVLDVGGTADRLWQDTTGLTRGSLLDGGSIKIGRFDSGNLVAAIGYVVVEPGALLDVSGTTATMTLAAGSRGGMVARAVASAGGSIDIRAREGLLFEGTMRAAGGNASAAGGSLSLVLDGENLPNPATVSQWTPNEKSYPVAARNLIVTADSRGMPAVSGPDIALTGWAGEGFVTAGAINQGGFDWATLKSQNSLSFDLGSGDLALRLRAGLTIDAPAIAAAAGAKANSAMTLAAPYVQLGNSDWRYQSASAAKSSAVGGVSLRVDADTVDLIGQSSLSGFDSATINSRGDIRLVGEVAGTDLTATPPTTLPPLAATGSFTVAGTIDFTAAQMYPTTLSQFQLSANSIAFNGNNAAAPVPLSAAGQLTVSAQDIVQNGVVRAPLGSLIFDASNSLSYGPGSLTSVATSGIIPAGLVQNGRDWLYDFGNGNTVNLSNAQATNYFALPEKRIISRGAAVNFSSGAVQYLSGGGDLYAYEFTPGPGGSKDVLARTAGSAAANVFAILPGYSSPMAPRDFQYAQDGGLKPGDSVYLSGIPGLANGYYTLLPAHYALLSGAYSITAKAGTTDMAAAANLAKLDGSWLVAGYRNFLGGGAENRWSGFLVTPATQVRKQSGYTDYSGNTFLTALATMPNDGGHVVFDVSRFLALDGLVRLSGGAGGKNGIADISAPEIAVVADSLSARPGESAAGAVILTTAEIAALGADSLLLGGVRDVSSSGDQVTVGASQVVVAGGATLSGPEIILAAASSEVIAAGAEVASPAPGTTAASNGRVLLKAGSAVIATGTLAHLPETLLLQNKINPSNLGADGALLRVSNGAAIAAPRSTANGVAAAGLLGTLDVEAGATVAASGSVMFDATHSTVIGAPLKLDPGTALSIGANRISLGDSAPSTAGVLRFGGAALTALDNLSSLSLTSYSSIDIYGSVNLGSVNTRTLNLSAVSLQGIGGSADSSTFRASNSIRFDGLDTVGGTGLPAATASGGSLAFNASDILLGNGSLAIRGFSQTALNATDTISGVGVGAALIADGNLTLAAGKITVAGGADASFAAGQRQRLTQSNAAPAASAAPQFGGKLAFQGKTITSDATIVAVAGQVSLSSTATANDIANGLDVSNGTINVTGGSISAAGAAETFGSTVAYAPGGSIALDGGPIGGNVTVGKDAVLDVSAIGADAGTILFKAADARVVNATHTGKVVLNGIMKGSSVPGVDGTVHNQGNFVMDVDNLDTGTTFGALNANLDSGGFTASRNFRVRHDNVTLAAGETMTAHRAVVAADNGNISVAGTIDARGTKGGSIELYAAEASAGLNSGNVTIAGSARLLANATTVASSAAGSTGDGGSIVIGTSTSTADVSQPTVTSGDASISLNAGALLDVSRGTDVSGNGLGQDGTVLLRAPRLNGNNDVAIATLDAAAIYGSRSTTIEAYKVYTASVIGGATDSGADMVVADSTGAASGTMYTDANTFINSHGNSITSRLNLGSAIALTPGMEVRSTGDLTVSVNETLASTAKQNRGWNFDPWLDANGNLVGWRFKDQNGNMTLPGVLTLRAAGNLIINGSISDGFTKSRTASMSMPDWALDTSGSNSWSYRLVGGADHAAANPQATLSGSGDVKFSFAPTRLTRPITDLPVALVRTGTGFIKVAAGRDVLLDTLDLTTQSVLDGAFISSANFNADQMLGASIYTAGRATTLSSSIKSLNNAAYGSSTSTGAAFTSDGGAISILAKGNVVGPVTDQMINNWLFRQGRSSIDTSGAAVFDRKGGKVQNTAWWSRFDYFDQGIATFGGGNISVIAETGDVSNVAASVATNANFSGSSPTDPAGKLNEQGGGDLYVRAGGDIRGGSFYAQKGTVDLNVGRSLTVGDHIVEDTSVAGLGPNGGGLVSLRTILAGGDTQFQVTAGKNLDIESAFNPTMTLQSARNVVGSPGTLPDKFGNYSTYSAGSSVSLTAVSGNLVFGDNANAIYAAGGGKVSGGVELLSIEDNLRFYLMQPGSLRAMALSGDIRFEHGFSLAPSALGQLDLLARGSILAEFARDAKGIPTGTTQPIVMIDRDPATMPSALKPSILDQSILDTVSANADGLAFHTAGGLHAADPNPAHIIALDGSIDFSGDGFFASTVVLPKRAEVLAGRDIIDFGFSIQHLSPMDVTTINAGRDIVSSTKVGGHNPVGEVVSGPGQVQFAAGRNFDLGNSAGVVTRGSLDNPYLPARGADIAVMAGATADYERFSQQFSSVTDLPISKRSDLVAYMRLLQPDLDVNITPAAAWTLFNGLALSQRRSFFDALFFDAVARSAGAIGGGALNLPAFDATIARLFATDSIGGGSVNVFGSQLKTDRGGSITIYAPGGSVYAGLTSIPTYMGSKKASDLGLFTILGGAVQSLVKTDFLVNQGRVFTLGGGDITLVSQYGNIDAGKGAKTAQAAPPPILTTDKNGNTQVDISGSISGSGIATLRTGPDVPASNVYPIAPRGIFDAGDAGVRSTGSVIIVAQTVLNANNIAAAGSVSGAHTVDSSGMAGAAAVPSNAAVTKTDAIATAANPDATQVASLSVELLGYGGEGQQTVTQDRQNSRPSPADCKDKQDCK